MRGRRVRSGATGGAGLARGRVECRTSVLEQVLVIVAWTGRGDGLGRRSVVRGRRRGTSASRKRVLAGLPATGAVCGGRDQCAPKRSCGDGRGANGRRRIARWSGYGETAGSSDGVVSDGALAD
jgi:hypothetical protein